MWASVGLENRSVCIRESVRVIVVSRKGTDKEGSDRVNLTVGCREFRVSYYLDLAIFSSVVQDYGWFSSDSSEVSFYRKF